MSHLDWSRQSKQPNELKRPDEPYYFKNEYGFNERLTRRWDRSSPMLGMLLVAGLASIIMFCLGIVYGKATIENSSKTEITKERRW